MLGTGLRRFLHGERDEIGSEARVRSDGRAARELRLVRLVPDFTENPLASVLVEIGRTKVLCTA
jgi:ribonuclease PH